MPGNRNDIGIVAVDKSPLVGQGFAQPPDGDRRSTRDAVASDGGGPIEAAASHLGSPRDAGR